MRCLVGAGGRLQAGEFLYETRLFPDVEYTFKHALIHDVAYRSLLQDQRRTFHRRVAGLIQAQYQHRIADFTEALAGHSERGEMWEVAAIHHRLAAVRAKERSAYASGARSCERAIEMAERAGGLGEERLRSLLLLGDLRSLMGDLEGANQTYDGALELASDAATNHAIASRRHRSGVTERNGVRIVYYEHGAGAETVFVVNPLLYGLATFQPVLEHLCQDFRVITMDCRGTGASDRRRGRRRALGGHGLVHQHDDAALVQPLHGLTFAALLWLACASLRRSCPHTLQPRPRRCVRSLPVRRQPY